MLFGSKSSRAPRSEAASARFVFSRRARRSRSKSTRCSQSTAMVAPRDAILMFSSRGSTCSDSAQPVACPSTRLGSAWFRSAEVHNERQADSTGGHHGGRGSELRRLRGRAAAYARAELRPPPPCLRGRGRSDAGGVGGRVGAADGDRPDHRTSAARSSFSGRMRSASRCSSMPSRTPRPRVPPSRPCSAPSTCRARREGEYGAALAEQPAETRRGSMGVCST